ncbi:MAG: hypothetical protein LBD30_00405 [Verrucomicrobiales bacterium]|jgi:hypothetical protein|nr:hypothetical protein [Verrucomicrobiales bacterium]
MQNDTPSIPAVSVKDDVFKISFWVSQMFILVATVAGVYLAATLGFRQAIAYGDIQSDKNNYYLRLSLKGELLDNVERVKQYAKKLESGGFAARQQAFALDTFVWESMKFSNATLETPSDLLTESRNFYRQVADINQKVMTNDIGGDTGARRLQELVGRMEKEVLPKFDSNLGSLKQKLAKSGITL